MSELAGRCFLAKSADLIESVSVDTGSASVFGPFTSSAVFLTLSALSSDVAVASGASSDALVRVEVAGGAHAYSVFGVGTGGAGSDAGGSDEVESFDAGGADGGTGATGVAGVGAVVADTVDGHGLRVSAGGAERDCAAGLALFIAGDTDAVGVVDELVRVASFDAAGAEFIEARGTVDAVIACTSTALAFRVAANTLTVLGEVVNRA